MMVPYESGLRGSPAAAANGMHRRADFARVEACGAHAGCGCKLRASAAGGFGPPTSATSTASCCIITRLIGTQLAKGRDMRAFARQSCGPPMAAPSNRSVRPAAERRELRRALASCSPPPGGGCGLPHIRAPRLQKRMTYRTTDSAPQPSGGAEAIGGIDIIYLSAAANGSPVRAPTGRTPSPDPLFGTKDAALFLPTIRIRP